jgi:hypothetical protein
MKHGPPCLPGTLQVHSRVCGPALELGRCDLCFTPNRVALRRDLRAAGRVPFFSFARGWQSSWDSNLLFSISRSLLCRPLQINRGWQYCARSRRTAKFPQLILF